MAFAPARSIGPGRPKDMEKRAAILEAAKRLFPQHGYEGTSMDAIAAEAGVSKLTVYSHFGGKDSLFVEAVRTKCEERLSADVFAVDPASPVRGQLLEIARAFFALITSEEAIGMHRTLVASAQQSPKLAQLFWEAGPAQVQRGFAALLQAKVEARQLDIPDTRRAATQFFALIKGECHARMEFGCGCFEPREIEDHLNATVDMFLRAYASR
ncbi:MAG: TetR/AcrR family transcriptional regulator [Proteobacteria bacterium]|nr:TetR/AcrR family transcriptional regulator [Pseudomonadota bacterium]